MFAGKAIHLYFLHTAANLWTVFINSVGMGSMVQLFHVIVILNLC